MTNSGREIPGLGVALLLLAAPARAQQQAPETGGSLTLTPSAIAVDAENDAPHLDGKLDDPSWQRAAVITGFRQIVPNDGAQPTAPTEVRVLYDREALYVGARLYDSEPSQIAGRMIRRDAEPAADQLWITIDSYHDHRTAFQFGVNPAGVRLDEISTNDPDGPDGLAEGIVFRNPDFRVRSLRSNLVVRWEYVPGSTLFLVWNHGRSGDESDPTFRLFDQLKGTFTDTMENTLLVKVNYWLSI